MSRLVRRGMTADDARARMATQASDEQRRAMADVVLDNSGTEAELAAQVDRFWTERVRHGHRLSVRPGGQARVLSGSQASTSWMRASQ